MDTNMDANGKMCGCNCGSCSGGRCGGGSMSAWCHGRGHHWLLRFLMGLFILAVVFKVGFAMGEFKGEFIRGGHYRGAMMQDYGAYGSYGDYGYGPGMMGF